MKRRSKKRILSRALGIMACCLVMVTLGHAQQQDSNAEDPRMAGFKGKIAKNYEDSKEDWPLRPQAPAGAANVFVILLDDTGYGQLGPYGGVIETPNIDKLAAGGLTYTDFHTTALCSPSRAAIAAGRNHHSIGLGGIVTLTHIWQTARYDDQTHQLPTPSFSFRNY